MNDELKNFLKGLDDEHQEDPFAHLEQNPETTGEDNSSEQNQTDDDKSEWKPRNRRERRLEAKLEAERQASIELAARLESLSAAQQAKESGDYLKAVERIYGTESPEAREATEILKQALIEVKESAKREALSEIEQIKAKESRALSEAEEMLENMAYEIEDEFGVDFSTKEGQKLERDFYRLLERMSPKDKDGNVIYYADHFAVWETLVSHRQKSQPNTTQQKELASRSMTQGSSQGKSDLQVDTTERFLRENGLI